MEYEILLPEFQVYEPHFYFSENNEQALIFPHCESFTYN